MTPLLSKQLLNLNGEALPLEALAHRRSVLQGMASYPALENALTRWGEILQAERAYINNSGSSGELLTGAKREREAQTLFRTLVEFSQRLVDERPVLNRYETMLEALGQPQPYIPRIFKSTPLQERSAKEDPDYRALVEDAKVHALEVAESSFVFSPPRYGEGGPLILGFLASLGLGLGVSGILPSELATDGIIIAAVNCGILAFLARVHLEGQRQVQLDAHIKLQVREAVKRTKEEIRRIEQERMSLAMEERRAEQDAFEAEEKGRRLALKRQEDSRVRLLARIINGQKNEAILKALFPLELPIRCLPVYRWEGSTHLNLRLDLPIQSILPPSVDGVQRPMDLDPTPGDRALAGHLPELAAAIAIRSLYEVFFHLPALRSAQVSVVRPSSRGDGKVHLVDLQADRQELKESLPPANALTSIRSFKGQVHYQNIPGIEGKAA